jgi:transcriptional regulator with XRE-family HTH domain
VDARTVAAQRRHHQELRRLGSLLRQLRLRAGLTQVHLAASLGRSQSFVTKYESGRRRLDIVELAQVCAGLGVDLEECVRLFKAE